MKMTFEEWLNQVDSIVARKLGIGLSDLPDCNTRDWYDDGLTPDRAAARAIKKLHD